ncbi:hypothetical protein HZY97_08685 [Sphingomonas sp. R-74633]|nr:hypothetical protein [Sphingomonas sp. R-74633]
MDPSEESPPLTPRKRRGLVIIVIVVLLLVVAIFLGLNLSHYQEMKQGAAVGNASGVPGPGGGS